MNPRLPSECVNAAALANALLDAAAEVERDETTIRAAIIAAATAGDCTKIITIVTRWQSMPAAEVLKGLPTSP